MQSAQNIPIPQRQRPTARNLHPYADLAPERHSNIGLLIDHGFCEPVPEEEEFLDLFGFDDLDVEEITPVWPNFVPGQYSSEPPAPVFPLYMPSYTPHHQSYFQDALQGSGETSTAGQCYSTYRGFRERHPSYSSVLSMPSYSSIDDQYPQGIFRSSEHSWTTYNTNSFTTESFGTGTDLSLDTNFSAGILTFENSAEAVAIFGASHWPGLPHVADPHLFDIASYATQLQAPINARHSIDRWIDNKSCDLNGEWGSVVGSLENQNFVTNPQYLEWQDSTARMIGFGGNGISNFEKESSWNLTEELNTGGIQTYGILEEQPATQLPHQPTFGLIPMPSATNFDLSNSGDFERKILTNEIDNQVNKNCFILEDGSGNTTSLPLPYIRGRERGRLPPDKRKVVAERRRKGRTCIRCRVARVECDGHSPCQRCIKLGNSSSLGAPCIKASFSDIVKSGSCNYISQRNINHLTLDGSRRVKMILPESFDLPQLLQMLDIRRNQFNIRARQAPGSLYILDLNACYEFLNDLQHNYPSWKSDSLRTFIDETLIHTKSWFHCVTDCDPRNNKILLLSQWNNMPSRATYSIIPHNDNSQERSLDPENDNDKLDIYIAAQISRIVCRKLELDGYVSLQTEINKMHTSSSSYLSRKSTTAKVGKILLTLRWRMSWWQLLGDGSNSDDIFRDRIGSWVGEEMKGLRGEWSSYPDSSSVFDDFPTVNSIQGFENWLERGKALIQEANAEKRFKK